MHMAVSNKYMPKANETAISVMCGDVQRMIFSIQDARNSKRALFSSTEQKHTQKITTKFNSFFLANYKAKTKSIPIACHL